MKKYLLPILIMSFLSSLNVTSQTFDINDVIIWKGVIKENSESGINSKYISFDGAYSDAATNLPLYWRAFPCRDEHSRIIAEFSDMIFEPCTEEESALMSETGFSQTLISATTSISVGRKIPQGILSFIPIRNSPESGAFEKLISFSIHISYESLNIPKQHNSRKYAENSVLSDGEWIKIKVAQSGIYKIGYSDLQSYGINPVSIDPKNIRIYSNAMGMLPEKNSLYRYDDLEENAILVVGEDDGVFDQQDYILFYGMSPHTWQNVLGFFTYQVNLYDDYNYYYLTTSFGEGKRLEVEPSVTSVPNHIVTKYNDYKAIEQENLNLILSGKEWYGDNFGAVLNREYSFNFPNINTDQQTIIKTEVANRVININEMMVTKVNDNIFDTINLTSITPTSMKYAQKKKKTLSFVPSGPEINIELEYLPSTSSSLAWLDYIMVNATCNLQFINPQMSFRDLSSVLEGAVSKFVVSDAYPGLVVWEISNPLLPKKVESTVFENELTFTLHTDSLRQFIAFDGTQFMVPEFVEQVENQNLHSEGPFDVIIVSHPMFLEEAGQLAALHELKDGFAIKLVTPNEIYNEFSSGKQDPSAIRDYIKMFYDKFDGEEPKFLILFGDGSFDPKDRIENNSNLIPTFQTEESLIKTSSYVIDDYFGYLDENEGEDGNGELDIGIGRIPVETKEEASIFLDKIERYLMTTEPEYGNWRNRICMIADDEDGNLHLEQADSLTNQAGLIPDLYNQQKIYLDAYTQVNTPSGKRYPEVTEELNKAVNRGALVVNYVGHGGKAGWALERILQIADIISWKNKDQLPVFITASCEFSRFDDPEVKTGGELVLLNEEGGGIALFTTTRVAYAQSNFKLNQRVYGTAFSMINGERPYLGDIIQRSKPPGEPTTRNFVLLGDPALKMAYPSYQVRTLNIKSLQTNLPVDTLRALDQIQVSGEIADVNGNSVDDFNGFIEVILFDKKTRYVTRGNDPPPYSFPVEFFCQDKILWLGKSTVINGKFETSFMVPKDMAYNNGSGKISYYAWSNQNDASGYYNEFTIGGINPDAPADLTGPDIELSLTDTLYNVNGSQFYNKNPKLLAFLSDQSGINVSAGGIGHNITAVLDDDFSNILTLNDYFIQDLDNFKSGKIEYPLHDLSDGTHTLTLKSWDNYNNSSEKTISFVVNSQLIEQPYEHLFLSADAINYPNPFNESTTFSFKHNRPGEELEIELELFDSYGNLIQTYKTNLLAQSTTAPFLISTWYFSDGSWHYTNPISVNLTTTPFLQWFGDDLKGNKLKSGIYFYTIKVTDEENNTSVLRQKLALMN